MGKLKVVLMVCVLLFVFFCGKDFVGPEEKEAELDCPEDKVLLCNVTEILENIHFNAPMISNYIYTHNKNGVVLRFMVFVGGTIRNTNEIPVDVRVGMKTWVNGSTKDPDNVFAETVGDIGTDFVEHEEFGIPYIQLEGVLDKLPVYTDSLAPRNDGSFYYLCTLDFTDQYEGKDHSVLPLYILYDLSLFITTDDSLTRVLPVYSGEAKHD